MKTQALTPAKINVMSSVSIREQLLSSNAVTALAAFIGNILEEEVSPVAEVPAVAVAVSNIS